MRRLFRAFGVALLAMLVIPDAVVIAQGPPGVISGRVVNGTAGVTAVSGTEIALHVFQNGDLIDIRDGTPDGDGRFAFQEVEDQEEGLFYIVITTYLDIPYSAELTPADDRWDVEVTVYESTGAMDRLSVTSDSLFILDTDSGEQSLSILEVISLVNQGDRVFIPNLVQGDTMAFLRFPLPPGAIGLNVESELPQGEVLQVDRGFAITTPVPPGEHGVAFTYTVPYTAGELDLSRRLGLGAGIFRLLVPEELGVVMTGNLEGLGTTDIGATSYRGFGAAEIEREGRLSIVLTGLPKPSLMQRLWNNINVGSPAATGVVGVFVLALAALFVVSMVRRRPVAAWEVAMDANADDHAAMTHAVASLDDRFQRGELEEGEYRRRRSELKARLLRLVQREEAP